MSKGKPQILIAAGGTGGHVFPAIAIADEIKKISPDADILFTGTKGKIEVQTVPKKGYKLEYIWISGFHRSLRIENLLFPLKVIVSLAQSFFIIKHFHPDMAIGTGGYVCGPVLYIASILGLPVIIHESNSYPGVTTRILSAKATYVFTAFNATSDWLKRKDNIQCVGTPTRDVLEKVSREEGIKFFNFDPLKKTVLVFGGSLGAASINRAIDKIAADLDSNGIQLIWQTGISNTQFIEKWKTTENCRVNTFIDKMEYAYAAADIVICRAGATTLAELTRLGKASILIPYPHAAADHQTFNAKSLANAGAAVMISDKDVEGKLKDELINILNDDRKLSEMKEASRKLGKPGACKEIAQMVLGLIK